jgi:DNA modification methylase
MRTRERGAQAMKLYDDMSNDDLIDLLVKKGPMGRDKPSSGFEASSMPRIEGTEQVTAKAEPRWPKPATAHIPNKARLPNCEEFIGPWRLDTTHNTECLLALRQIPDNCLDLAVTSPPYWGQRGNSGLGLEPDPRDYVQNLVNVLAEVMRCLKPSGTLWLNIGDSYNTPINWREADYEYSSLGKNGNGLPATNSAYTKKRGRRRAFIDAEIGGLQYGNLLGIPYRIIFAMTDLKFLFRGEIIWEKTRPLPEGLCRRPHRRHEGIYIFAKSERHNFRVKPPVGSIWRLVQAPNRLPHCSTFPLDLPIQCIKAASNEPRSAIVCDPFMGSGTTGKAAMSLGCRFIGFELDPAMCELANRNAGNVVQMGMAAL